MEEVRLLLLALVSAPPVDAALPATAAVAEARAALLPAGASPEQVDRGLGLGKYQWICGGFTGADQFAAYLAPGRGHRVLLQYRLVCRPGGCELRLESVKVSRE